MCRYIRACKHAHVLLYIYIHIIHICISATALCAFGATGLKTLLSDICYPVLSAFLLIGAPPDPDG